MSKKERIEDLGKLSVILKDLMDDDLFDRFNIHRAKYAWERFCELDEDQKIEFIESIAYGIERLEEKICDCLCIANGDEE